MFYGSNVRTVAFSREFPLSLLPACWFHNAEGQMLTPISCMLQVWDPQLIIAQIITVQCLFYISLGLIQAVTIGELQVPSSSPPAQHPDWALDLSQCSCSANSSSRSQ
jgi:hypothetical protein